jgi:hypothetical protein
MTVSYLPAGTTYCRDCSKNTSNHSGGKDVLFSDHVKDYVPLRLLSIGKTAHAAIFAEINPVLTNIQQGPNNPLLELGRENQVHQLRVGGSTMNTCQARSRGVGSKDDEQ